MTVLVAMETWLSALDVLITTPLTTQLASASSVVSPTVYNAVQLECVLPAATSQLSTSTMDLVYTVKKIAPSALHPKSVPPAPTHPSFPQKSDSVSSAPSATARSAVKPTPAPNAQPITSSPITPASSAPSITAPIVQLIMSAVHARQDSSSQQDSAHSTALWTYVKDAVLHQYVQFVTLLPPMAQPTSQLLSSVENASFALILTVKFVKEPTTVQNVSTLPSVSALLVDSALYVLILTVKLAVIMEHHASLAATLSTQSIT